jgi:3-deoxy-D-manno-octulosonate 8-phosphate phosphatase (KDO 8-P phosphatase)
LVRASKLDKKVSQKQISLIVYDFDGVMTDNLAIVGDQGQEFVIVNRGDGLGINLIKNMNIPQIILSTEKNPVVKMRAKKLGIPSYQVGDKKKSSLENYCRKHGHDPKLVLYVGNDKNDLEAMKWVGIRVAPRDAHPDIKRISHLITRKSGGQGVVRELADRIKT